MTMTRAEVVKGLTMTLALVRQERAGLQQTMDEALRAAIALLTAPTTEEIEAAREWLEETRLEHHGSDLHPADDCYTCRQERTLRRGLDALAREPGMEVEVERMRHLWDVESARKDDAMARIAALEAKLARVRVYAQRWADGSSNEAMFGDILLAALLQAGAPACDK